MNGARLGTHSEDFVLAQPTFAAVQVEMVEEMVVETTVVETTVVETTVVVTKVVETMAEETMVAATNLLLVEVTGVPSLIPTLQADTLTEAAMPKYSTS